MLQDAGDQARQSFAVTPSDTANQPFRRLFVGDAGTVALVTLDGTVSTYKVVASTYIRCQGLRVNNTGTSPGTNIVGEN